MNVVIDKTYRLQNKIGEGSFGKIFSAVNKESNDTKQYAIKLMLKEKHPTLFVNEISIYERLKGVKYIPSLYAAGSEGKYNYLVMDLLEQNLEQLRTSFGSVMNIKVILHLGVQMLNILETIHAEGIIHRDIKPENFLIRTNPSSGISELYLIDFGLATLFFTEETGSKKHIPIKNNEVLIGTPRYMSTNVQQGFTASRKDDLESLGYVLIYLQKGELPWQNLGEMAAPLKQSLGWAFSAPNAIIGEFILFIHYCRNLSFSAEPNYAYLRNLLTNLSSAS